MVKEKERTLFHYVYDYLKKKNKRNKVFIVHRLDKDTSGIIIFAKVEVIKYNLQDNWDKIKRNYVAIVNGKVEKKKDTIKSYLNETKTHFTYSFRIYIFSLQPTNQTASYLRSIQHPSLQPVQAKPQQCPEYL